jgi:hypothetical protein
MAKKEKPADNTSQKKQNWTVIGFGVNYPGHPNEEAAKQFASEKEIPGGVVKRLADIK